MTTSPVDILNKTLLLIFNAFNSLGSTMVFLFVSFVKISPLPDEVDFLLVCMLLIWIISMLIRVIRGR